MGILVKDGWGVSQNYEDYKIRYNKQSKRVEFIYEAKNCYGRNNPYSCSFLLDIIDNSNEVISNLYQKVIECYNIQKRLHPEIWKEQKSYSIKGINYWKKNRPYDFKDEKVKKWLDFILPYLRKRV